jgi:hypothetical protein
MGALRKVGEAFSWCKSCPRTIGETVFACPVLRCSLHAKGEASSGQRVSCNDVPLVMRLLTREWHALGERSMDVPEYEEAIKACL